MKKIVTAAALCLISLSVCSAAGEVTITQFEDSVASYIESPMKQTAQQLREYEHLIKFIRERMQKRLKNQQQSGSDAEKNLYVENMGKYVDTEFGFSFWYPSQWSIETNNKNALRLLNAKGEPVITLTKINAPDFTVRIPAGACGSCAPVNYFFDKVTHQWMKQYPQGIAGAPEMKKSEREKTKRPQPVKITVNTMGGLHMFSTEQRESAVVIPLSASHFVRVDDLHYTAQCGSGCAGAINGGAQYLAKTIVAADPSVGVHDSAVQQKQSIKLLQTQYAAY